MMKAFAQPRNGGGGGNNGNGGGGRRNGGGRGNNANGGRRQGIGSRIVNGIRNLFGGRRGRQ